MSQTKKVVCIIGITLILTSLLVITWVFLVVDTPKAVYPENIQDAPVEAATQYYDDVATQAGEVLPEPTSLVTYIEDFTPIEDNDNVQ